MVLNSLRIAEIIMVAGKQNFVLTVFYQELFICKDMRLVYCREKMPK